jgi:hypothetical protein
MRCSAGTSIWALRTTGKNRSWRQPSLLNVASAGTSAPNVSVCTAKVVSLGPALSANASFWPCSGTVARSVELPGGQTAVS